MWSRGGINAILFSRRQAIALDATPSPLPPTSLPLIAKYFSFLPRPTMKVSFVSSSFLLLAAIPMGVNAFHAMRTFRPASPTGIFMSDQEVETTENPCWQDVYGDADDDCGMSTVYSSSFVAEKWIKSMPCGHDVDVSVGVGIIYLAKTKEESVTK